MKWFVWKDGKRWGPLWQRDLEALIQSGEVTATHVARREGSTTWTPVGRIPELAAVLGAGESGEQGARAPETHDTQCASRGPAAPEPPAAPPVVLDGEPPAETTMSGGAFGALEAASRGAHTIDPVQLRATGPDPGSSGSGVQTADSARWDGHGAIQVGAIQAADDPGSSYIARHWRGDLPLPATYWLNGAFVSLMTMALVVAFVWAVDFTRAPRVWSVVLTLLWVAVVAMALWQVVGVWRSAGRHVSRGGTRGWAVAARVAIVLGCLQMAFVVATQAVPQLVEFGKVIAGRDPISGYHVRLLRNDTEMEISGYIAFGLTDRVTQTLNTHPGVTVIHLNTGGGRVVEARKLRDVIASRHLNTYVSSECASACVIPFLAGERRLVAADAKVGFHQYTFAGRASAQTVADMETDKGYFIARGVSTAFVERAFRPTSDLWYPTQEQMLAAGYITGRAGGDEVALSGMPVAEMDKVEANLRDDPLYAAIAEHDPDAYRQIAAAVRVGFQQGQSLNELRAQIGPLVHEVYQKRLPFASDDAVVEFARLMVDQLQVLQNEPEKCVAFMSPGTASGIDFTGVFGRDLMRREEKVMADVIRSAADGTWRPPRDTDVAPIRGEVFSQLLRSWSPEDLQQMSHLDRPGVDGARACSVCRGFYKTVADLPRAKAGAMLRFTFAGER